MNPSILYAYIGEEKRKQILEQIRAKYPQADIGEIDDGIKVAIDTYLQTIEFSEEDKKSDSKRKSLY